MKLCYVFTLLTHLSDHLQSQSQPHVQAEDEAVGVVRDVLGHLEAGHRHGHVEDAPVAWVGI